MSALLTRLTESTAAIRSHWDQTPDVGIVLGSGLGACCTALTAPVVLPTISIPHFKPSTAIGHAGRWHCGWLGTRPTIIAEGRIHAYEGYDFDEVVYPIRVMHALGVRTLILTNAAGGLQAGYRISDIVLLDDHINLMFGNPLRGPNADELGPRFPDMCDCYDRHLLDLAQSAALEVTDRVHRGVYAAMLGPCYETQAEYRMLQRLGADVVGMSTVPENIAARHCGLRVLGISVVSNLMEPSNDGHKVIANVSDAQTTVKHIITQVVEQLS